jgi:hypothetical protein
MYQVAIVNNPGAPTPNDFRFPLGTEWRNSSGGPLVTDMKGDIWKFSNTIGASNNSGGQTATWLKITGTNGPLLQINTPDHPAGPNATPTSAGILSFTSTGGTVTITQSGFPNSHTINFESSASPPSTLQTLSGDTGVQQSPMGNNIAIHSTFTATIGAVPVAVAGPTNNALLTITLQGAGTAATSATMTAAGLAYFNAAQFTSSGGFISLIGGSTPPTLGLMVDNASGAGVNPVIPNSSGIITLTSDTTLTAGTLLNGIRTDTTSANTAKIQLQYAGANASATASNYGISQYNSSQFTVVNGFVSLTGSGSGFTSINIQTFNATGVYTPSVGMAYCIIEAIGGGGGGGGSAACSSSQCAAGGAGAGGSYGRSVFSAATIGASQTVTIGARGMGGNGNTAGTAGGNTSVGALITSNGGGGGAGGPASSTATISAPGLGGTSTGTIGFAGVQGLNGIILPTINYALGGQGGYSIGGGPGQPVFPGGGGVGLTFGSGGAGATTLNSGSAATGGNAQAGVVYITEFIG